MTWKISRIEIKKNSVKVLGASGKTNLKNPDWTKHSRTKEAIFSSPKTKRDFFSSNKISKLSQWTFLKDTIISWETMPNPMTSQLKKQLNFSNNKIEMLRQSGSTRRDVSKMGIKDKWRKKLDWFFKWCIDKKYKSCTFTTIVEKFMVTYCPEMICGKSISLINNGLCLRNSSLIWEITSWMSFIASRKCHNFKIWFKKLSILKNSNILKSLKTLNFWITKLVKRKYLEMKS